jgi:hypothetical protein
VPRPASPTLRGAAIDASVIEATSASRELTLGRHSGARQRREPGIQMHAPGVLLDSGPGAPRRPGMTTGSSS